MELTNYYNTFIEIAEDCLVKFGAVPPQKGSKIFITNLQYDMISQNSYIYFCRNII